MVRYQLEAAVLGRRPGIVSPGWKDALPMCDLCVKLRTDYSRQYLFYPVEGSCYAGSREEQQPLVKRTNRS